MSDDRPIQQYEEWKKHYDAGEVSSKETFENASKIALLLCYDLTDKLRYWEKETLDLPDDQIAERVAHMVRMLDHLRTAYLSFAEMDL